MIMMECGEWSLDRQHEEAWDQFFVAAPLGTLFHRVGWKHVIERAFRHSPHYVFTEQDGAITGILPLVHVKSLLFGKRLVSVPFCVNGGPAAVGAERGAVLIPDSRELGKAGVRQFSELPGGGPPSRGPRRPRRAP